MKSSLCLFICSLILLLNLFECFNKIKHLSLRKIDKNQINNNENILDNDNDNKNIHRKNILKKKSHLENSNNNNYKNNKILLNNKPNNSTENSNNTHLNNNSEIYMGNCFVKIHNNFYNLNPIDQLKYK